MTDAELQTAKRKLIEAFEQRCEAARLYVEAVEYVLPLVDGDIECVKAARRAQNYCEHFCNSVKASMATARVEDIVETFRVFVKESKSWE